MKRSIYLIAVFAITLATSAQVWAQSQQNQPLGDYARAAKKAKGSTQTTPAGKVYDNDNLPKATSISVVGDSSAPAADPNNDASKNADGTPKQDVQSGDKNNEPNLKAGQSADERQKALDAWKDKLGVEQEKIGKMAHELELIQREYQVKQAEFWANTAERAQNPSAFREQDDKFKQEITDKQKSLDDEKTKLGEMQDDARKAGAPNSVIEGDSSSEKNDKN
jgi:hypothetical protein